MSARAVHLRIARLVIHDTGGLSAGDLETAIGEAIRQRLEGLAPLGAAGSLSERIANAVLTHPQVAGHALPDRELAARLAHPHAPLMSMSGRNAHRPEEHVSSGRPRR